MARTTTYYGLNISEGTDPVNPLVDIFPNFEDLDSDLKDVSDAAVGTATELTTGTVHALTRSDTDRDVFLFVATSNYDAGETFTLDGVQVTALTPDGQPLASGSYVIGSVVLCAVQSTLLTVYVNPAKAKDSDKLDGQHGSYYATASDVTDLGDTVTAISNKVGSAVLTTTAPDCSGAINELNSNLSELTESVSVNVTSVATWNDVLPALKLACDLSKISGKSYIDANGTYYHCIKKSATSALFSNDNVGSSAPTYNVTMVVASTGQAYNILNTSTGAVTSGLNSALGFNGVVTLHY